MDDTIESQSSHESNQSIQSPITPKSFSRMKSKTVTKKSQNRNTSYHSITVIENQTNPNKRKLDEYEYEYDIDLINNNNNEPNRKKRKCIENNTNNKLNILSEMTESNISLKKQNSQLTKQSHHYQHEVKKWKSKYMKLYSKISEISESEAMSLSTNDNTNINADINTMPSPTPPPSYFDKAKHKNNSNTINTSSISETNNMNIQTINDNIITYNGDSLFGMGSLINSFSVDSNKSGQLRSDTKRKRKRPTFNKTPDNINDTDGSHYSSAHVHVLAQNSGSSYNMDDEINDDDSDNNAQYIEFENSYHVSVNCHFCNKHFDDIFEYRDHIKQHYNKDSNKTWKHCDFGCQSEYSNDFAFIGHIATHVNNKPFKCDVLVNDTKCGAVLSRKQYLKEHWKRHFSKQTENYQPIQHKNDLVSQNKSNCNAVYVEFEDSYHVAVHCHMCRKLFDDFCQYKEHLIKHYNIDPTKTWKQCDFGCKPLFRDTIDFISHIASQHTKEKPFICDVVSSGTKCGVKRCRKADLKQHWQTHFQPTININKKKAKKHKIIVVDFEDSYFVSVNCHLCKKHFNNFIKYRDHIREHYQNDPLRTWLKCDFGCNVTSRPTFQNSSGFMYHIASHTQQFPFKCNLRMHGDKCNGVAGIKGDIKKHWNKYHNIKSLNIENKNNRHMDSSSESENSNSTFSESESATESDSESSSDDTGTGNGTDTADYECVDFNASYVFLMECHICNIYLDDCGEYRDHIKQHYINDADREWMECDFGCTDASGLPVVSTNVSNFIAHIAMHSKQKPFQCTIKTNGIKCTRTSTTRCVLKTHWKLNHFKKESESKQKSKDLMIDLVKNRERKRDNKKRKKKKRSYSEHE